MKTETVTITENEILLGDSEYATDRNIKILQLLSQDKRPKQIAEDFRTSTATIRWCIEWMRKKNGFHSMAALVAAAIRQKII